MIKLIGFIVLFILYLLVDWLIKKNRKHKFYSVPDIVKETFTTVQIPVSMIEVFTNNYQEEIISDFPSRIEMADALYDSNRNVRMQKKDASVLVTFFCQGEKKIRWNSETIDLSTAELKGKLHKVQFVTVYYKKDDLKNYYFDLEFLK